MRAEVSRDTKILASFEVAVADDEESRQKGLMRVERLCRDKGMVFLFPAPSSRDFYMKDTLIPLDIAFWNTEGVIVDKLVMSPCRTEPCPRYESKSPFAGALEVNEGRLDDAREGDLVRLEPLRDRR